MLNPILAQINNTRNNPMNPRLLQNLKNTFNMLKMSNNPTATLNEMMINNPQLQSALKYIKDNGGDARQAFYNLAKEKGINPDDILQYFR